MLHRVQRRARQQLPGKAPGHRHGAPRASRRQHRGLGARSGWPRSQAPPAPALESLPVPRDKAELRGCHQVRLPGPGLDGDSLCGRNREAAARGAPHRQKLPERPGARRPSRAGEWSGHWSGHQGGQPSPSPGGSQGEGIGKLEQRSRAQRGTSEGYQVTSRGRCPRAGTFRGRWPRRASQLTHLGGPLPSGHSSPNRGYPPQGEAGAPPSWGQQLPHQAGHRQHPAARAPCFAELSVSHRGDGRTWLPLRKGL